MSALAAQTGIKRPLYFPLRAKEKEQQTWIRWTSQKCHTQTSKEPALCLLKEALHERALGCVQEATTASAGSPQEDSNLANITEGPREWGHAWLGL